MAPKAHVFIVDDDFHLRTMVANVIAAADYTSHLFASAAEVETALTKWAAVLIILDLSLTDSDGIEVIHSLARARFAGSVLLISGHDLTTLEDVRSIGQAEGLKMLPSLHKPFRAEDLRAAAKLAGSAQKSQELRSDLEMALQNNWLQLWYQPKIDLQKRSLCGAECLIRMAHPEKGILSPWKISSISGRSTLPSVDGLCCATGVGRLGGIGWAGNQASACYQRARLRFGETGFRHQPTETFAKECRFSWSDRRNNRRRGNQRPRLSKGDRHAVEALQRWCIDRRFRCRPFHIGALQGATVFGDQA